MARATEKTATDPAPLRNSAGTAFPKSREDRRSALTHDQIAADLADFQRAGGRIEVLGTTNRLKSIGKDAATPDAADTALDD